MSEQERIMNVALLWGGCFCLTAAFCLSMGNDYNREKRNWLIWMELSAAALLCCDAAAWFVQGTPGEASHLIMVATNFVVYAGLYLVLFLFNHYVGCYLREDGRLCAPKRSRTVDMTCAVGIGLVFVSQFSPLFYYIYAKIGFQVSELFDDELLKEKVVRVAEQKNVILEHLYHKPLINPDDLYKELTEYRDMVAPFVCDVSLYLHNAIKEGKEILLEGQLGSLKDPDHGIYPMVTSSSTLAAYGAIGAGIPPYEIKQIITVCKAYSSAVGAGAFVSEIFGEEADELRRRGGDGGEFGATTGRPRRMGWFDCVASKYGCRMQGTTDVAFTVLDVLGYLDEIPVCVGYEINGEVTTEFPVTHLLKKSKTGIEDTSGMEM